MHQRYMHWLSISWQSLSWWGGRNKWNLFIKWGIICHHSWWWTHEFKGCPKMSWLARMGKAIQNELTQFQQMGTCRLVNKPPNAIPIANKWTFIKKRNKIREVIKYKARLVAKGCAQWPGYDYVETYSPIVWMETIQAILVLVPLKGLKIQQMDIKGAYLNWQLKEKVYMQQPEGYEDTTGQICKLVKTLYGLKQSGHEWNREFDKKLKKFRFQHLRSDPCIYIKQDGDNLVIATVWVDNILLFASSDELMQQTKLDLCTEWVMTNLSEPTKIIGIEITQTENSITISQKLYIKSILEHEGLSEINSVGTPLDLNIKLRPNPDGNEGNWSHSFTRLLRELQYLANRTRPDIAFTVNRLAAYTANPSLQHVMALKQILWYLAGTINFGITYSKTSNHDNFNIFNGFSDAAHANHDDHKPSQQHRLNMLPYLKLDMKHVGYETYSKNSGTPNKVLQSLREIMTAPLQWQKTQNSIIGANTLLSGGIGSENLSNKTNNNWELSRSWTNSRYSHQSYSMPKTHEAYFWIGTSSNLRGSVERQAILSSHMLIQ